MKMLTLLAATAMALAPAAALALAPPAKTYVMKAGASDMFETESSKLVMDSANPEVVSYANMMIADHGKSTSDVMAAASADGLPPMTPVMMPKQKAMIDSLKRTSGKARDRLYVKDQIAGHKETLAFQKQYAMMGDKPRLKDTAGTIVPVVQNHLAEAQSMASSMMK